MSKIDKTFPPDTVRSKAMRMALQMALAAANTDATILLLGETGSGKDYMAEFIHRSSKRASGPFLAINCAALSQHLVESEIFGHEAGSFTGAHKAKKGLLELANGGTILLNEIGELPPAVQPKLLSFLDTGSFYRVGGQRPVKVYTRILAATNRELTEEIEKGLFRKDLFYRLEVLSIRIPPLRERSEDLPGLLERIWGDLHAELKVEKHRDPAPDILAALMAHQWPGNVRELRNTLYKLLILPENHNSIFERPSGVRDEGTWSHVIHFPEQTSIHHVMREARHALIDEALRRAGGNQKKAAELLDVSYVTLRYWLRTGRAK